MHNAQPNNPVIMARRQMAAPFIPCVRHNGPDGYTGEGMFSAFSLLGATTWQPSVAKFVGRYRTVTVDSKRRRKLPIDP
jgi:hypothetical protein